MKLSNSIVSNDRYFILGLTKLLGEEFIDRHCFIIDLDANSVSDMEPHFFVNKTIVVFASKPCCLYKSKKLEGSIILDKRCSVDCILSFFKGNKTMNTYLPELNLSLRERQILSVMCREGCNKKIATELGVSIKTIYTHRRNIMNKLGCKNRIELQKIILDISKR